MLSTNDAVAPPDPSKRCMFNFLSLLLVRARVHVTIFRNYLALTLTERLVNLLRSAGKGATDLGGSIASPH